MSKNIKPSYLCDYERVNDCKKILCQKECYETLRKDRAKLDDKGKPIITGYIKYY